MGFPYGTGPPQPLAPMKPVQLGPGVSLVTPLSRKGIGPGIIILAPAHESEAAVDIEEGIPSLRMKWAEEGYCVVEIRPEASSAAVKTALVELEKCEGCEPKEKVGLVSYSVDLLSSASAAIEANKDKIVAAAVYANTSDFARLSSQASVPTIYHLTGKTETRSKKSKDAVVYEYASQSDCTFPVPFHKDFHYATEAVSHSRNLTFLKPRMGGPYFDLEAIWEEHTYYEFEARNVENTMNTMVEEPYVNHVPTITGGIGRASLTEFYRDHFVFSNPDDTELELISRTVGIDRVVDEFIYKFTHDKVIDWLYPGVPPTHKYVQIPMMAVVNVRGDRLYHEHINWDHASALHQIDALPATATLTVPRDEGVNGHANVTGDGATSHTKRVEIQLPTAGKETVEKMRDKNAVASNYMFAFKARTL